MWLFLQGYFVILSWMPIYFNTVNTFSTCACFQFVIFESTNWEQVYHVDLRQAAWFSALPWVMMAILGYFAGALSDLLIQNGFSITFTRKIMQVSMTTFLVEIGSCDAFMLL